MITAGEDGLRARAAFTTEEQAQDLAGSVHLLFNIDGQREEVMDFSFGLEPAVVVDRIMESSSGRRPQRHQPAGRGSRSRSRSVRLPNDPLSITASAALISGSLHGGSSFLIF